MDSVTERCRKFHGELNTETSKDINETRQEMQREDLDVSVDVSRMTGRFCRCVVTHMAITLIEFIDPRCFCGFASLREFRMPHSDSAHKYRDTFIRPACDFMTGCRAMNAPSVDSVERS